MNNLLILVCLVSAILLGLYVIYVRENFEEKIIQMTPKYTPINVKLGITKCPDNPNDYCIPAENIPKFCSNYALNQQTGGSYSI